MPENNLLHHQGILRQIAIIAAEGASGRLDIVAGATEGALLFKHGKLVDARVGYLIGFQAINAVASMPDTVSHFDSSVVPPMSSSITANERVVLKQFFGIDTVDSKTPAAAAVVDEVDEATVITSHVAGDVTSDATSNVISAPTISEPPLSEPPPLTAPLYQHHSKASYITAFALGVLVLIIGAAAVLLRDEFRERSAPAAVATTSESVSPAAAETTAPTERTARAETTAPAETTTPAKTTVPADNTNPSVSRPVPVEPKTNEAPAPAGADLTGSWKMVNTVHNTAYRSFQNLQVGFALSINQTGTTFTAKGQKVSENGRSLPASSRTPIQVKGSIHGDKVEATFLEQGGERKTNGRFVWTVDRAGRGLTGTFSSTAARSSGKSAASREL